MGVVAIVGRPNVGKSTLFNRLIGERKAVVDDFPGVTRDRNYAQCTWNGRTFTLMDTGGYVPNAEEKYFRTRWLGRWNSRWDEADLLLLVVDAQTGPTDYDATMARMIRDLGVPYRLIVNKVDRVERRIRWRGVFTASRSGIPCSFPRSTGDCPATCSTKSSRVCPKMQTIQKEKGRRESRCWAARTWANPHL